MWWCLQSHNKRKTQVCPFALMDIYVRFYFCEAPGSESEETPGCLSIQADKVEGARLIAGINRGQYLL